MGRTRRIATRRAIALSAVLVLSACSGDPRPDGPPEPSRVTTPEPEPESEPEPEPTSEPERATDPEPVDAGDLDLAIAVAAVRHLAGTIGPREATGESYA